MSGNGSSKKQIGNVMIDMGVFLLVCFFCLLNSMGLKRHSMGRNVREWIMGAAVMLWLMFFVVAASFCSFCVKIVTL